MGRGGGAGLIAVALAGTLWGCGDDEADEGGPGNPGSNPFGNPTGRAGSGSSSGASGSGPSSACPEGYQRTTLLLPRVILVVDGSCSMTTNYPANGQPSATRCENIPNSRWSALRNALLGQNGVVARLDDALEFGLVVYGTQPRCPLTADPIDPALGNSDAINDAFRNQPPGMYTPTGAALDWVYENMILGQTVDVERGPEIVILATDGEPNSCGDATTNYQPSIDAAMKGRSMGVTTYVISLADATGAFHDHLQQLADIGGGTSNARLYEPTTPQELAANLESLVGGAVGCDLALNGWVQAGKECMGSSVTLGDDKLECNSPNGWVLSDPRHIRLQGTACQRLMNGGGSLKVEFPCGVFTVD